MKITKQRLKEIIAEELKGAKNEGIFDFFKKKKKSNLRFDSYVDVNNIKNAANNGNSKECDLLSCILGFLEETSAENRLAFEEVDLHQKPQVQVANEIGIPLPTLKSRVQRTRKFLKGKLETCCPDYSEKCK